MHDFKVAVDHVRAGVATLVAAACGGDDKPAYCENVSDLQSRSTTLKSVQLSESGALSTLQTDLQKIQSDANAVVSSAKEDFPGETSAPKSSVSSLSTTIDQSPSSPTAQQSPRSHRRSAAS